MLHCTHRHTISLTVYCTLSHFRCLAISFPLSVFMYVFLSLCLCSSQRHQNTHTHTHATPCAHSLRDSWKSYMHVINQNDHISLAHNAVFIARNDDTIDFFLPRALRGNTLSVGVSNFWCVCVSSSQSHPPNTWLFPKTTPGRLVGLHLFVIYSVIQHLTHTLQCHRFTVRQGIDSVLFQKVLLLTATTTTPPTNPTNNPPSLPPAFKFSPR